jgi:hypothetical protein
MCGYLGLGTESGFRSEPLGVDYRRGRQDEGEDRFELPGQFLPRLQLDMFLFTFRSRVNPKSKKFERLADVGGAYVNCWINFKDFEAAEKLARLLIKAEGWIPEIKTANRESKRNH